MSEEPTTPNLAEYRIAIEADSYDEFAVLSGRLYATDAVLDMSNVGLGTFEGLAAILGFIQEYWSMWEEHHHHVDEIVDLGHGVGYTIIREDGRMKGGDARVEARNAWVAVWDDGRVVRTKMYTDLDDARADAELLAQERATAEAAATSIPIERARRRWEAGSHGDFQGSADEYAVDGVLDTAGYGMGTFRGRDAIRGFLDDWIGSFDDLTMGADEVVGFGDEVVLAVYHQKGRPLGGSNYVRVRSAWLSEWADGEIARATIYTEAEIDQARADAKRLAEERG
jgi:ketosteroid isomerase-like protein